MVGCATEQAATKIGLEGGTPVIAGTTDAASESISGGGLNNGDIPYSNAKKRVLPISNKS